MFGQAFRLERRAGVKNECCSSLARPSVKDWIAPLAYRLGIWAGPEVARHSQRRLLGRAFAEKQVHEGPRVYEPDTY